MREWGTPVVCVSDYKVTLNQSIQVDQYPLSQPDPLFYQLSGGKEFLILDLLHAYRQKPLTEDSKDNTTINTNKGLY